MQIDIKTTSIEPIRHTFCHVARRIGADKPASRYQEATLEVQPEVNFHYRPLWDPDHELFDTSRTVIKMEDWYAFKDPRQYYYGTWTITRSRQQDSMERNFSFVEKRDLLNNISEDWRKRIADVLIPLRHMAYGANLNNTYISAYGYGTAITQTTSFASMDHLGIAQYLTRIGLLLDGNTAETLEAAKQAWMDDPEWQPLRKLTEKLLTLDDWFELYVAQSFVLDGLLYPLIYDRFDKTLSANGASSVAMLTEFMVDWQAEQVRCVNAFLKTAANESEENRQQLSSWVKQWCDLSTSALRPLSSRALGEDVMDELKVELLDRANKKCQLAI